MGHRNRLKWATWTRGTYTATDGTGPWIIKSESNLDRCWALMDEYDPAKELGTYRYEIKTSNAPPTGPPSDRVDNQPTPPETLALTYWDRTTITTRRSLTFFFIFGITSGALGAILEQFIKSHI